MRSAYPLMILDCCLIRSAPQVIQIKSNNFSTNLLLPESTAQAGFFKYDKDVILALVFSHQLRCILTPSKQTE